MRALPPFFLPGLLIAMLSTALGETSPPAPTSAPKPAPATPSASAKPAPAPAPTSSPKPRTASPPPPTAVAKPSTPASSGAATKPGTAPNPNPKSPATTTTATPTKPVSAPVAAAPDKAADEKKPGEDDEKKPDATIGATLAKKKTVPELEKTCDQIPGLFRVYRDKEKGTVYLYVKKKQLGREFIYFTHSVNGVPSAGHIRGGYGDSVVVKFARHFNKVEVVEQNTAFYFDPEHPLARAADANLSHAVLASEEIIAEDEKGIVINAGNLFLKEALAQIKPSAKDEKKALLGKLSDTKTKFSQVRSYPKNTLFVVEYVYDNPAPPARQDEDDDEKRAPDTANRRAVSVSVQHTLIAMPKSDYRPRADDPRIGYFSTQVTDQTSTEATPWRDFIHRWDLRKKDPAAPLSEPVKPIVWWMENTTPLEFRDTIREAALKWNKAFEKLGYKNALVIKQQPDDAKWDAGDIRFNVLRWTSSPSPPFGGYGPSFVNPRTGEILGADIMLEFLFVKNRIFATRIWGDVGLAGEGSEAESALALGNGQACCAAHFTQQSLMLGQQMLRLRKADTVEVKTLVEEGLRHLIIHELGHTLGLNHNFRASHLHTPQELLDRNLTLKTGLSGSVMDYMPLNLAARKGQTTQYYMDDVGPYDEWAIEYGYSTYGPDVDEAGEHKKLTSIAARSHESQLGFANDADDMRRPGKAIDPRAMVGDMSSDPIAYAKGRCELVRQATKDLLTTYPEEGKSWQELTNAYITLTTESGNALTVISRFIGGIYVDRAFAGQIKENAPPPFKPVDREKQLVAMKALAQYAFAADAWDAPADLLAHLQQQRRGFDFRSEGEDPKLHERIRKLQKSLLEHLLSANTQNRILDSTLYGNGYPLPEMMGQLTDAVLAPTEWRAPGMRVVRQNLQLDYVDMLLLVTKSPSRQPASQATAWSELKRIEQLAKESTATADASNQAHVNYLLYKIRRGLDEEKN